MTDFDPGDYVTIQATQDMNGYYLANTVTMNRKGTPQERTAASRPLNTSMHAGQNPNNSTTQDDSNTSNSTSDDNRPA